MPVEFTSGSHKANSGLLEIESLVFLTSMGAEGWLVQFESVRFNFPVVWDSETKERYQHLIPDRVPGSEQMKILTDDYIAIEDVEGYYRYLWNQARAEKLREALFIPPVLQNIVGQYLYE